jgi:hypothetical protein
MYNLLIDYCEEYGRFPTGRLCYKGEQLGIWIGAQRGAKRGKNARKLGPERIAALEKVHGWTWYAK